MKRTIVFVAILLAGCSTCKRCYGEVLDATTVAELTAALQDAVSRDDYAATLPQAVIHGSGVETIPSGTETVEATRDQIAFIKGVTRWLQRKKAEAELTAVGRIIIPATATVELSRKYGDTLRAIRAGLDVEIIRPKSGAEVTEEALGQ